MVKAEKPSPLSWPPASQHSLRCLDQVAQIFIRSCRAQLLRLLSAWRPAARRALLALGNGSAPWAAPSADFAPRLGPPSVGPLALSKFIHAAALSVDEAGAQDPRARGAAPAAAPGFAAGLGSASGSGSAPAAAAAPAAAPGAAPQKFEATRPFVVAVTHVPTGANVLLGRVAQPMLWSQRSTAAR